MRALTLWQPWGWAIVAGHKLVENRPWAPPRNMLGVPFAIHAGKIWDEDGAWACRDAGVAMPCDDDLLSARGAVIGVATIDRVVRMVDGVGADHPDSLTPDQARWFFGPFGWVLRHVRRIEVAVPCRGFQMFWSLPAAVEADVRRQLVGAP